MARALPRAMLFNAFSVDSSHEDDDRGCYDAMLSVFLQRGERALWLLRRRRAEPERLASVLGYPLVAIKPHATDTLIPLKDACLIALLCSWLLYGLFKMVPEADQDILAQAGFFGVPISVPLIRALIYRQGAPIGLWGRILTRRLIIPERDRVYLVPGLAMTLGLCLGRIPSWFGASSEIMAPLTVFVVLVMVLGAGPSLGRWWLVGSFHSSRPAKDGTLVKI